jgi:tetratricopeptide (TPR) repeat protein
MYLYLQNFRTVQLVQNIIRSVYSWFNHSGDNGGDTTQNETLMSRMIGESLIPYGSDLYNAGIEQFRGNVYDILSMFKKANIPVILGTLTSNLREMKPFVSVTASSHPSAEAVFKLANQNLIEGKIDEAKINFLKAKELDALRFRAPQKINNAIHELGKEFNFPVVEIDSIFSKESPYGIVGYNLTVDHLHPNIEGYSLIAKSFYQKMARLNLLPKGKSVPLTVQVQDSLLRADFPMTKFDSTLSKMRIIMLIGSYPFVPKGTPNYASINYKLKDLEDSLAVQVLGKRKFWETAHVEIADLKYKRSDYNGFLNEMMTVIEERPFNKVTYEHTIDHLINAKEYEQAVVLLMRLRKLGPSFYTNKWLGQIALQKGSYSEALNFLEAAVKYDVSDSQLWYNLSGAYFYNKKYKEAKLAAERSLNINPQNQLARNLYDQLKGIQ